MDGLQRRNPRSRSHASSLKPPRHPGGPSFHPPPASRPLPNPSPPGGRPRKKVRFASEAGGHQTFARHDANTGRAERTRPQNCDAKTTEFKFFKKLWEQSGCTSRSLPKQKEELHNVTPLRKLPDLKRTLCSDETFATPSKNEEISADHVNVQASNSAHGNNDASHLNQHDYLPSIQILTPTIQTSFEAAGISRNTEPGSGHIFSEKRRNLLKIAAKTMSMETSELLQRRSELFADILQRLGAANIIKKHHKESMRRGKMVCRHPPADPTSHSENRLDYRLSDFDSSTKLRRGKEPSSYASDEHQFMALPWECNQGLSRRGNDVRECMALPWVSTANGSSSDWKIGTAHDQVPDFVLEDVQPHSKGKPDSANEFSCNTEFGLHDYHEQETMLPVTLAGSISNGLPFPCEVEEQHVVPYAVSTTFWQPDLQNSLVQCTSSSVGLEGRHKDGAGLFHDSDAVLLSRFDQLRAKCADPRFLDLSDGILDHNDYSYISNFISESNNIVSNANRNCLSSISSTSELPFELGSKSLYDSAVHISSLAALDEKYLTEVELIDSSDIGPIQGMDQLSVKFTASSLSNYTSRILDHPDLRYMSECPPKDSRSILTMDSDDSCLALLPSFSAPPGEQDWKHLCDSSIELWSSVHHLRSHGGSLEAKLGFMPDAKIYSDFEDNHSAMLVEENPNKLLGTSNISLFGSCFPMDSISEAPMFSPVGIRW